MERPDPMIPSKPGAEDVPALSGAQFVVSKPKKTRQSNGLNSKSSHGRKNGRKYRGQGKG